MTMYKLLPCPFCGVDMDSDDEDTMYPSGIFYTEDRDGIRSYHSIYDYEEIEPCYQIVCQCGAEMHGDSKAEVVENWNKRYCDK